MRSVLGLPVSDPFAFLQALVDMLRPENRDVFQVEGKAENPLDYRPLLIGLLLVYACYGDLLFCTGIHKGGFPENRAGLVARIPGADANVLGYEPDAWNTAGNGAALAAAIKYMACFRNCCIWRK